MLKEPTEQELVAAMPDNRTLIEGLVRLRDKRGLLVPLRFNPAQQYYWQRKTRRNNVLKARQKGLSKVIDADQLMDCVKKPTNAVVISHEKGATQRLFQAVRSYIEEMEVPPETSIDSKSQIVFPKAGSSYFVGTAGQKAFGRGDTVHRAHLSEAAFYDNFERILAGIGEAAEYGQIDIETTPNGREAFYDHWQRSKAGLTSYTNIFIPWFIDSEYSVDTLTEKEKEGLSAAVQNMFAIPDDEFIASLTPEETDLVKRVATDWEIVLTPGQLKWRRYKIWDKGALFFQEYPEDDVSCFLQTGRSVFKHIRTDKSRRIPLDDVSKINKKDLERLLGADGRHRKLLYAGLDPSEGTPDGDPHAFAVIEKTKEGASVIFEMTSNEPIDVFARKVAKIADTFYLSLGVEKQGVGVAMCQRLKDYEVVFEEWSTSASTRPMLILELEEGYRKEELIESYEEAENEARDMIYNDANRPDHPPGKHDDRVFARGIAMQQLKQPVPSITFI